MMDEAGHEPPPERSGADIDIWGDGSATRSTPIPDWWGQAVHEVNEVNEVNRVNKGKEGPD